MIAVNPRMHAHVDIEAADALITWLTSREGQDAIASFRVKGRQVFFPNATGGQ